MKVKFTTSIASAEWSYACNQVVHVGAAFTPDEIPAGDAAKWLESGIAVRVEEAVPEVAATVASETADLKRAKKK